jgi:hypothetical protein
MLFFWTMCDGSSSAFVEALERRSLLSAGTAAAATTAAGWVRSTTADTTVPARAPTPHVMAAAAKKKKAAAADTAPGRYVVGFYGLGGASFGNAWLAQTVTDVGGAEGATTRLYQQDQGQAAVTDYFAFVDVNGDHILSADEINHVTVDVIGYSFGGVQAAEFTRALTATGRRGLYGYRLADTMPVHMLVTVDPVNTTAQKHTDGPTRNVAYYLNYYQTNPGGSTMTLTPRGPAQASTTYTFDGSSNPVGGVMPSLARHSTQILVDDDGPLSGVTVTQAYSHFEYGTLQGADVNHMTMPWFLYQTVLQDFTG